MYPFLNARARGHAEDKSQRRDSGTGEFSLSTVEVFSFFLYLPSLSPSAKYSSGFRVLRNMNDTDAIISRSKTDLNLINLFDFNLKFLDCLQSPVCLRCFSMRRTEGISTLRGFS